MVAEVRSLSFGNKGDCLMFIAVREALRSWSHPVTIGIDEEVWTPALHGAYGLVPLLRPGFLHWKRRVKHEANRLLKRRERAREQFLVKRRSGISHNKVEVIFDVGGFRCSDFWGHQHLLRDLAYYRAASRQGKKIIWLPKTFGPVQDGRIADTTRELIRLADVVFVRDDHSMELLSEIGAATEHVLRGPDYTGSIEPRDFDARHRGRPCIIPNYRMIDKCTEEDAEAYLQALRLVVGECRDRSLEPLFVIHSTSGGLDARVVELLREHLGALDVWSGEDPLQIKGLVGAALFAVSSRLHGIVNALSQGVPTIAFGWAHKYEGIMNDYAAGEWLVDVHDQDRLTNRLREVFVPEVRSDLTLRLRSSQQRLSHANASMWDQIEGIVHRARVES